MPRPRYDAAVDPQFSRTVEEVARRPEVLEAVSRLYDDVQREINARKPVCVMSGRCCRFEEYGHRLFVTFFDSEEAIRAAEPRFEAMGEEFPEEVRGRRASVDVYEVAVDEQV